MSSRQFVHKDPDGNLMVIAVMYTECTDSSELEETWRQMPSRTGEQRALSVAVDARGLLPAILDYYRFSGSLITPPCSEGVTWVVLKMPGSLSKDQVARSSQTLGHPNNRLVQPTNARIIVQ